MIHFLLTYSLDESKIIDMKEFRDGAVAARSYVEAEKRNKRDSGFEIVLVGADSLEALHTTHGHYFDDSDDASRSPYLAGV